MANNHIIIMPSLDIQKDTIYILLSVSEEFTPNKLILIKMLNKIIEDIIENEKKGKNGAEKINEKVEPSQAFAFFCFHFR